MKIHITAWNIIALIGLATHELINELIRPLYGQGEGVWAFILGVLPNFLAAACIFPFMILTIRDSYVNSKQKINEHNLYQWFIYGLIITTSGLIIWEFIQKSNGNLVYDLNDIIATLSGSITAYLFYILNRKRYISNEKKRTHI